jgi:hypothetical protein
MVAGGLLTNAVWTAYGFSQRKLELIGPDLVAVTLGVTYLGTVLATRPRAERPGEEHLPSEEPTLILRPHEVEPPLLSFAASV